MMTSDGAVPHAGSGDSHQDSSFISIRTAHKSFGELDVLRGVSLEVAAGEIVALIGPSGSGKSTLIRCVAGLERLDEGEILLHGVPVGAEPKNQHEASASLGMVFQSFNVFPHMTVMNNVVNPLRVVKGMAKSAAEEWALEALSRVHLTDKLVSYPASLSGGQKQRLAIARALAMQPEVLMFDEPTSSLDPELSYEILETIKELADGGLGMLIATHQVHFIGGFAHKMAFMHEGCISIQGTPNEVLQHKDERLRRFLVRLEENA